MSPALIPEQQKSNDLRLQTAALLCLVPVVGGHHEVEQQPDGLIHVDLVGGGQPLVELVVDGGQDRLQPRHVDLGAVVQRVEAVVTKRLDHVPHVHQMNWEGETETLRLCSSWNKHFLNWNERQTLTVASLLHKPEFAGSPVRRQSDYIKVLSSCKTALRKISSKPWKTYNESVSYWRNIHTITVSVWEELLYVWSSKYLLCNLEPVRALHDELLAVNSEKRFLSVDSTHSFPWRAVSSPPWPCLVCCLPRSSCGTSNSGAGNVYC